MGCRSEGCDDGQTCNLESRVCDRIEGYCDDNSGIAACPEGATCCPTESYCELDSNRCVAGCSEDSHCAFGLPCIDGACGCTSDDACPDNSVCQNGLCINVECENDNFEPNGDRLTGTRLSPLFEQSQTLDGLKLCAGDVDVYTVWLVAGVEVSGALALRGGSGTASWEWRSPEPDNERLDRGTDEDEWSFVTETDGLFALIITYEDNEQLQYDLALTLSDNSIECDGDGSETTPVALSLEDSFTIDEAQLCSDSQDTYQLEMAEPAQSLSARLQRRDQALDTAVRLRVLDGDGNELASAEGVTLSLQVELPSVPQDPQVVVDVVGGGTPLGVRYRLTLESGAGESGLICSDDLLNEPNDSPDAALPLLPGEHTGRVICSDDEGDYWSVAAQAGDSVTVEINYRGDAVPSARLHLPNGQSVQGQTGTAAAASLVCNLAL